MDEGAEVLGRPEDGAQAGLERVLDFWNPLPAVNPIVLVDAQDFWVPVELQRRPPSEVVRHAALPHSAEPVDFWSLDSAAHVETHSPEPDWSDELELPWFDPGLSENPYVLRLDKPTALALAARRGRWLSQLFDIPEPRRRRTFAEFFAELFVLFPAKATYLGLTEMALAGKQPDSVLNGCQFKLNFLDTPRLSYRRHAGYAYIASSDPESMLSWRRAIRMAESCDGDPTDHIDDDWFKDWVDLKVGDPLYWSYLDFVEWRLKERHAGYIEYYETAHSTPLTTLAQAFGRSLQSRTGGLVVGQTDHVGVIYPEPENPTYLCRSSRG